MDTINIIILFSLIISIALGYVLKANIGVFAILSAFIGAYLYGITPEKVINLWNGSLSLFFILLSITYFYFLWFCDCKWYAKQSRVKSCVFC